MNKSIFLLPIISCFTYAATGVTNLVRVSPSLCNNNRDLVYCKRRLERLTPSNSVIKEEDSNRYAQYCGKWTKHFKYYCPRPNSHGQDVIRFCSVYSIVCGVGAPKEPVLPWEEHTHHVKISNSSPLGDSEGLQRVVPVVVNQHIHVNPSNKRAPQVEANTVVNEDSFEESSQSELNRRCRTKKRLADRFCFGNLSELPSRAQRRCKQLGKERTWQIKIPGYSKTIPGAGKDDVLAGKRSNIVTFDKEQSLWTRQSKVGRFWDNIFKHVIDTKQGEYGIGTSWGSPFFGLNKRSYGAIKTPSIHNPTGEIAWGKGQAWGPFWTTGTSTAIDWFKGATKLARQWSIPIAGVTGGQSDTFKVPSLQQIMNFVLK